MSARRLFFRSFLFHRRSRLLFFWYCVASAAACSALWWRLDAVMGPDAHGLFFQSWFRAAVMVACSALAAAFASTAVAGPVGRIEEWLEARRDGSTTRALRVRNGDAFETLIRLLNELHVRNAAPQPERRKRPRTRAPVRKPEKQAAS